MTDAPLLALGGDLLCDHVFGHAEKCQKCGAQLVPDVVSKALETMPEPSPHPRWRVRLCYYLMPSTGRSYIRIRATHAPNTTEAIAQVRKALQQEKPSALVFGSEAHLTKLPAAK